MKTISKFLALASLVLVMVACGENQGAGDDAPGLEGWAEILAAKETLDAKRSQLAELLAAADSEEDAEGDTDGEDDTEGDAGTEGEEATAEEPVDPAALQQEIYALAETFTGQLVAFINAQGISMSEDTELTPEQRQAFDFKAMEDILIAKEYIDKGGDYSKALAIYDTALRIDPKSTLLQEAKAEAEANRYMTEERFATVSKDMTQDEVRALLGTPKPVNVREFEEKGVTGWFYPKEEARTASGVYFKEKKGELVVYETDFNAIEASEPEVRE